MVYERPNVGAAIDSKNATRQTQVIVNPLNEDCAACTYTICRDICADLTVKYGGWGLERLYMISGHNRKGGHVKTAGGGSRFSSHTGKIYPEWNYHTAALAVLSKGKTLAFVVIDNLLLKEPGSLDSWAGLFEVSDTFFIIRPFVQSESIDGMIKPSAEAVEIFLNSVN